MIKLLRYTSQVPTQPRMGRRRFLQVFSLGAAGFAIGCRSGPPGPTPDSMTPTPPPLRNDMKALGELNAFVKVGSDNTVTVVIKHAEFGQGVTTGLTTIVAEEMDADWEQMAWEFAPADSQRYMNTLMGIQGTGGSSSIANSWQQLRQAGAGARALLVQAAAEAWQVKPEEITVDKGRLSHRSGKEGRFGEFASVAAQLGAPKEVPLKKPEEFNLIGKAVRRLDVAPKTDGKAVFTIDVQKPGMVVAVMAHPPRFGAKVTTFDPQPALQVEGVLQVVETPRGVAVVGRDFWSASQGRKALKVEWDESQAEKRGTKELFADFRKLAENEGAVSLNEGDALKTLGAASEVLEVEYEFPFLAHATMEPMACVMELTEEGAEITHGAQIHTLDQMNVASALGLSGPDKVRITSVFGGGSFGRRAVPDSDYVVEAALVAKGLKEKAPVKLIWDRTDDLKAGRYRPMSFHRLRGSVDREGRPEATHHRVVVQSFFQGTPFEAALRGGVDNAAVEGSNDLPYAIPHKRVDSHIAEAGVPTLWWRSVGHTHNAFVTETFFDRLCAEGGQDPIEMRRLLLRDHPRHLGVLELLLEKAGEFQKGPGRGRGVAVHKSFNSYVAELVEVTMMKGKARLDRVVCAVDCGLVINPDIVTAQMESGIVYGLSAALGEEITLEEGRVKQANFDTYPVIRMPQAPPIEVFIMPSAEPPTGVGEPGLPPLAPALANAIRAAGGPWITKLPMKREGLV